MTQSESETCPEVFEVTDEQVPKDDLLTSINVESNTGCTPQERLAAFHARKRDEKVALETKKANKRTAIVTAAKSESVGYWSQTLCKMNSTADRGGDRIDFERRHTDEEHGRLYLDTVRVDLAKRANLLGITVGCSKVTVKYKKQLGPLPYSRDFEKPKFDFYILDIHFRWEAAQ